MEKMFHARLSMLLAASILLSGASAFSQTKINDGTVGGSSLPNGSAILEVESNNKGLLLSRVSLSATTTWGLAGATPVAGMLVYNTNASITGGSASYPIANGGIGCYYWDGSGWVSIKVDAPRSIADTTYWTVKGNAGTTGKTNFLGTTGNHPLVIKTNNTIAGYIDSSGGNGTTALGYNAVANNTGASYTGSYNAAFGNAALQGLTSGSDNVAVGAGALQANTSASWNTAVGQVALGVNTTGALNTGIGQFALGSNVTGGNNTAVGQNALGVSTGFNNTAVGQAALSATTTSNNTAVGQSALNANTTGSPNVAVGQNSLSAVTTGSNNVGVGNSILATGSTTASNNAAIGISALQNTTGNNNTALGYLAITNNTSGADNTVVGYNTGSTLTTGTNNIVIGSGADVLASGTSNFINVGNTVYAINTSTAPGSSNTGRKVGISATAPTSTLHVGGSLTLPITSTTASITLDERHHTLLVNNSSAVTVTLPAASTCSGRVYIIVHQTANTCNISSYFAINLSAQTTVGSNTSITLQSDGTNWYRII